MTTVSGSVLPRYRIVAFDGGPSGLTQLHMLARLVKAHPGNHDLLARADLFAGTSFGALIALWLAARSDAELANGPALMDDLIARMTVVFNAYGAGAAGLLRLTISRPAVSRARLRRVKRALIEELGFTDDLTVEDLNRHICIVSFDLRARGATLLGTVERPYGPKVFTNIEETTLPDDEPDLQLSVLDVALRSGAMPVLLPIVEGYVDGAMLGNNPTMCAISSVLAQSRKARTGQARGEQHLTAPLVAHPEELLVLSFGGDEPRLAGAVEEMKLHRPIASWRTGGWLLNPFEPLLLVRLLVASDGRGVDFQARSVIGGERVCRITPPPGESGLNAAFRQALFQGGARASKTGAAIAQAWAEDPDLDYSPSLGEVLEDLLSMPRQAAYVVNEMLHGSVDSVVGTAQVAFRSSGDWPEDRPGRLARVQELLAATPRIRAGWQSIDRASMMFEEDRLRFAERTMSVSDAQAARQAAHARRLGKQAVLRRQFEEALDGDLPVRAVTKAAQLQAMGEEWGPPRKARGSKMNPWDSKTLRAAQLFVDGLWMADPEQQEAVLDLVFEEQAQLASIIGSLRFEDPVPPDAEWGLADSPPPHDGFPGIDPSD
jgi:hypothetical protein